MKAILVTMVLGLAVGSLTTVAAHADTCVDDCSYADTHSPWITVTASGWSAGEITVTANPLTPGAGYGELSLPGAGANAGISAGIGTGGGGDSGAGGDQSQQGPDVVVVANADLKTQSRQVWNRLMQVTQDPERARMMSYQEINRLGDFLDDNAATFDKTIADDHKAEHVSRADVHYAAEGMLNNAVHLATEVSGVSVQMN